MLQPPSADRLLISSLKKHGTCHYCRFVRNNDLKWWPRQIKIHCGILEVITLRQIKGVMLQTKFTEIQGVLLDDYPTNLRVLFRHLAPVLLSRRLRKTNTEL